MLTNILILLFSILLIYQIFFNNDNLIESFDNKYNNYKYNPNNTSILSEQNAGNIEFLKKQINKFAPLNDKVQDLSGNITNLSKQIDSLIQAQQQYAESVSSVDV